MNIYLKANQLMNVVNTMLYDSEVESSTLVDTLDSLDLEPNDTVIQLAAMAQNLKHEIAGIDKAVADLQERKRMAVDRNRWAVNYIRDIMLKVGIDKVDDFELPTKLMKARKSINVIDMDLVPEDYLNTKTLVTVDKTLATQAIKDGYTVAGLEYIDGQRGVKIG